MITIYNLQNTQMKHSLLKMFSLDGLGWVLNVNVKMNILNRKAHLHSKSFFLFRKPSYIVSDLVSATCPNNWGNGHHSETFASEERNEERSVVDFTQTANIPNLIQRQ